MKSRIGLIVGVPLVLFALAVPASADQVILDDLIVDGSACIGIDCVNTTGEITTTGDGATAIRTVGDGHNIRNFNNIVTGGALAHGIEVVARPFDGDGVTITNSGLIETDPDALTITVEDRREDDRGHTGGPEELLGSVTTAQAANRLGTLHGVLGRGRCHRGRHSRIAGRFTHTALDIA